MEKEILTTPANGQQLLCSFGECSSPITFNQYSTDMINVLLYLQSLNESQCTEDHKGSLIFLSIYCSIHKVAWLLEQPDPVQNPQVFSYGDFGDELAWNIEDHYVFTSTSAIELVHCDEAGPRAREYLLVIKLIFSLLVNSFQSALTDISNVTTSQKLDNQLVKGASPQDLLKLQEEAPFLEEAINYQEDLWLPDLQEGQPNNSSTQVLHFLDAVTGWLTACSVLWDTIEDKYFQDLKFYCLSPGAPHHQLDIPMTAAFLWDIYPGKWQFDANTISTKINEAAVCAKCHAEAALMSKYLLVESCEFLGGQVMEIWVGVCKKLCLLCLALVQAVNEAGQLCIHISAGSHGTVFAWIPPEDVPKNIMDKLYINLQQLKSHLKVSHTQQSSSVSIEVKLELPKSVFVEDLQDALEKAALEHQWGLVVVPIFASASY
ncbi:hypothetical protein GYMLUDRAFT_62931 [Collybiopsis luxurians FD-317 M1]|uniref:Uncharacterized protein n=1 Tax=Collybiopsis luxurians FD-317 M1 TaxID=944289 RepID=A0A0D0C9P0_9AGAR|nr:hypothetical protein GYMLUDRAFT_62931 [Collybiopsis luxurians FD-317 M1]